MQFESAVHVKPIISRTDGNSFTIGARDDLVHVAEFDGNTAVAVRAPLEGGVPGALNREGALRSLREQYHDRDLLGVARVEKALRVRLRLQVGPEARQASIIGILAEGANLPLAELGS